MTQPALIRDDTQASVTRYLGEDHDRLDCILAEVVDLTERGNLAAASARFAELRAGLEHHIDVEERILFPEFERLTRMGGPVFVMQREHVEIRRWMERVAVAHQARDAAAAADALASLIERLQSHNVKEERVLYPATDRALGSNEARAALVGRIVAGC